MATPESLETLSRLRQLNPETGWYIVTLLVIVMYIYAVEIKRARETNNWSTVFAGLALFGLDFFNEVWNALIFAFTGHSAFWTTPNASGFIVLIGWNIEIIFMFLISGIVFAKVLPEDQKSKMFGLPNRWALAIGFAIFAVFVECLLNIGDYLIWEYPWWDLSITGIWLIFLIGYLPFFVGAFYVYDLPETKDKIKAVAIIYAVPLVLLCIFGPLLMPLGIF
jgi:hypothetical protein